MSNMFVLDFDSDSSQQKEPVTQMSQSKQNEEIKVKQTKSVVLKTEKKQKDKYISNQISKNILFNQDDDYFTHEGEQEQDIGSSQIIVESPTKQGSPKKSIRRKKVESGIKLQPLKNLEFFKTTQTISLLKSPQLNKIQSQPNNFTLRKQQQSNLSLSSTHKENLLNFEMQTSSEEQQNSLVQENLKTQSKKQNPKINLELSANVFFQDSDSQKMSQNNNETQQKKEQNMNSNRLKKKRSTEKKNNQKSQEEQEKYPEQNQDQKQQSDSEQAKVGIEQLNPENSKRSPNQETSQEQYLNNINGQKLQQNFQLDTPKNLLVNSLKQNSVLYLKLRRRSSLLNFFSPEFRIQLHQDQYFLMGSKKTSSKPTSTFIFSGSETSYDQNSNKFLGKMKSNVGGSVYNIFAYGLNPSDAKDRNLPPRQLLATVCYKTQIFGTGRPKQLVVFLKRPEYFYYRDFRGVRMYDDEIPLNQLFENYPENRGNIQVLQTRKPVFIPGTREYAMNFDGKVKLSSVKNFILQDPMNSNEKVLLFGKLTQDQFVLDIHSPLTPIVGIGIALTMFDSRMGSE